MINFNNKAEVISYINQIKTGMQPKFGILTPQHVLEHLMMSLHLSTGKKQIEFKGTQEVAEKVKAVLIYSDAEMPMGIKNPILTDELAPLAFENIETARTALKNELDYFYTHLAEKPNATHVHPRMNELTVTEWSTLHGKHFAHHFKQYGLM